MHTEWGRAKSLQEYENFNDKKEEFELMLQQFDDDLDQVLCEHPDHEVADAKLEPETAGFT